MINTMIPEAIKSQLLIALKNDQEPDLPTVYQDVCEELFGEDPEDLKEYFEECYNEIIKSDWWKKAKQERRCALWHDEQNFKTDRDDYLIEKNKTARKYG